MGMWWPTHYRNYGNVKANILWQLQACPTCYRNYGSKMSSRHKFCDLKHKCFKLSSARAVSATISFWYAWRGFWLRNVWSVNVSRSLQFAIDLTSLLIIVQQDATVFSLLYFCSQLYIFRALTPITSSLYNCNYSFWHWLTGSTTICSCCWVGTDSCTSHGTYCVIHMNQFQLNNKSRW